MLKLILSVLLGAANGLETGTAAPDFTLLAQDGKPVSLKDFRGKWVVLYFYPKDMTRGCTIQARNFQKDGKEYEKRNAVVLGVSTQDSKSKKEFCEKEGLTFKLLADTDHKVSEAYGSLRSYMGLKLSARNTFLIDPEGKIAASFTDVSPKTDSTTVLEKIDSLTKK